MDLKYAKTLHNLQEAFQNGLALAGPNAPCLGDRKLLERDPVRWADTITWQTWKTVDARRHALGSGLYKLFEDGLGGGRELRTVGIWSRNTSSKVVLVAFNPGLTMLRLRLAAYRTISRPIQSCIGSALRYTGTRRCRFVVCYLLSPRHS